MSASPLTLDSPRPSTPTLSTFTSPSTSRCSSPLQEPASSHVSPSRQLDDRARPSQRGSSSNHMSSTFGHADPRSSPSPDVGPRHPSVTNCIRVHVTPRNVSTPYHDRFIPARPRSISAAQQRAQLRLGISPAHGSAPDHCDALLDPAGYFARLLYTQSYAPPVYSPLPPAGPMGFDDLTMKSFSSPARHPPSSPLPPRSRATNGIIQRADSDPNYSNDGAVRSAKRVHLDDPRPSFLSLIGTGTVDGLTPRKYYSFPPSIGGPMRRKLPGSKYENGALDHGGSGICSSLRSRSPSLVHRDTVALMEAEKAAVDARQRRVAELPTEPYKVLDAPGIVDDFYLNILDWSSRNVISVALGSTVYLWDATTSEVTALADLSSMNSSMPRESDSHSTLEGVVVSSVKWNSAGNYLAIGTDQGTVQLWDVARQSVVREFGSGHHSQRIGVLAWSRERLITGSKDYQIFEWDHRAPNRPVLSLNDHRGEVTAIEWSPDSSLVATGGNDNRLLVWDPRKISQRLALTFGQHQPKSQPLHVMTDHSAAVRAVAWSPHQSGMLVSGGGTNDKTLRLWQVNGPTPTKAIRVAPVGSQVCTVAWSPTAVHELVTTHGFACMDSPPLAHANAIAVWDSRSLTPLANLTGHSARVLYAALSPDGSAMCTGAGAGDETLRLWKLFPTPQPHSSRLQSGHAFTAKRSSIWSSVGRHR